MAEVIERLAIRYQCSACRRSWSKRPRAEDHAAGCIQDLANRACATCKHDALEDDGFVCLIDARPSDDVLGAPQCVRNCPSWEPEPWSSPDPTEGETP